MVRHSWIWLNKKSSKNQLKVRRYASLDRHPELNLPSDGILSPNFNSNFSFKGRTHICQFTISIYNIYLLRHKYFPLIFIDTFPSDNMTLFPYCSFLYPNKSIVINECFFEISLFEIPHNWRYVRITELNSLKCIPFHKSRIILSDVKLKQISIHLSNNSVSFAFYIL